MDRTKRQAKAARDQHKQRTTALLSNEDEVLDLEEVVLQTRQRVQAAKAAKARAAALRQELQDLHEEEESLAAASDQEVAPAVPPAPVFCQEESSAGALVATSLKSVVRLPCHYIDFDSFFCLLSSLRLISNCRPWTPFFIYRLF